MKKLNVFVTLQSGKVIILTNVTSGQYRAIKDTLADIYPGATFAAVDSAEKPERINVTKALAAHGYDRFGDFVGVKEASEKAEDLSDEDEDETSAAAVTPAVPVVNVDMTVQGAPVQALASTFSSTLA